MRIAVITGASSGLGREYVKLAAREGVYEEIWLIARNAKRMEKLSERLKVKTRVLSYDLASTESMKDYKELLQEVKPEIGLLVCCAGLGKVGYVEDLSLDETNAIVDVNCKSAIDMTLLSLPYMTRGSRIMEICSVAAFFPLQGMAIYAASKAFIYSYSRALACELKGREIQVTAVCPYWIKDTRFIGRAKEHIDGHITVQHFPFATTAEEVAVCSYVDSMKGRVVSTPGTISSIQRILAKMFPCKLSMACWEFIRKM